MAPAPYPKKLFYRIQEVADIVGVEPYVLRYWETKFPMLSPEKDANDQRRYRSKDIDLLLLIRSLLYDEKYTIAGAVEKLKGSSAPAPAPDDPTEEPPPPAALDGDGHAEALRGIREELGLLRRELEQWRDELA